MVSRVKKRIWLTLVIFSFYLGLVFITRQILISKKAKDQASAAALLVETVYQISNDDFANPERGFMKQSSIYLDQAFDPSKISALQASDTIVWVYFRLDNYRDPRDGVGVTVTNYQAKPLESLGSRRGLDTVQATFDEARNKGLKLVIRFIYNFGPHSNSDPMQVNPDVPLSAALAHINQLKPLLIKNADVILAVQVGFVGHFGEWHSSKYLNDLNTRKQIVDALLQSVPKDRMLMLRYPRYKQLWYGGPITETNAYNQSDVTRIGLHDDAFLRDDTDGGTFRSTVWGTKITTYCDGYPTGEIQCWRDYVNRDSLFSPVGGEAGTQSSTPSQLAYCPNALTQLSNMHWSFINNGYSKVVLDTWVNQGCMPEIRQRLGYRFLLNRVSISQQVAPGGVLGFHMELENKGFASLFNPRPAILILKGNNNSYQREIPLTGIDPRKWLPGQVSKVDLNIPVPSDAPNGTYSLYLWLPDSTTSLRTRPQYAVRFANQNVWQPTTGFNLLVNNLIVGGNPITPTPTPTGSPTSAKLRFKIVLPDIASQTTNISSSFVQIEARDGTSQVSTSTINLSRSGNYFQTTSDVLLNITQSKTYSIFIKTRIGIGRLFNAVSLTQSQTLDCALTSNPSCGELITQRDSKPLLSGDTDGFNLQSGSFNKIDSADLQTLASQFNSPPPTAGSSSDFNLDGQVNITDLEILGRNYGSSGD